MAYLALYRTFRPATLDEVVRQEHIVTILKNQIKTGRIGHAYLFCGPRGTGKTSVAKIFAAAINCESPADGSPCGKCAACRALKDPSNLDISEIDAASNNGVDEMRDLREKVQYPPVAGKYKVYIVDEAHMLSTGAFNALLKTLEEPPPHAVFILATTEAQKIPATILSRCMRFDFKLIPQADLEARLKTVLDRIGKEYEEEAVSAIARAGAGSVRDMLSIADTCVSYSTGKLTYEAVNAVLGSADFSGVCALCSDILSGETGGAFSKTEKILAEGKSVAMLLKDAMNFFNACAVAKTCRDAEKILSLPSDVFAKVAAVAKATDGHTLLRATEIFADVENDLKYSASPRVTFETAVMKASMPRADYDIESLLARVAALEKRLDEGLRSLPAEGRRTEAADRFPEKSEPYGEPETVRAPVPPTEPPFPDVAAFPETPPPDESVTGGNVYFDFDAGYVPEPPAPPAPPVRERAPRDSSGTGTPPVNSAPSGSAESERSVPQATAGDSKSTFGSFLRALRRTGKNGVLFTICMDLEHGYEGEKFVLSTSSETMYRSLTKEAHYELIGKAMNMIGVTDFEIRFKDGKKDEFNKNLDELKERFKGVKIDVR